MTDGSNIADNSEDRLVIAGREFLSRLMVGTGRYGDMETTKMVIEASEAQIVTVALRRVNLSEDGKNSLIEAIPPQKYTYLPNSAGCYNADEAVRTLRLACELGTNFGGIWDLVKLEVIGDKETLLPDVEETIKAAKILAKEGFSVMAYTSDDLISAKKLEDVGCVAVMPLAAPIGSGLGILNPYNIELIASKLSVPVIVDAGIGTASDACLAMELGCSGVLLNTAISAAQNPVLMVKAMKNAVKSGRLAYLAGRMPKHKTANASSPSVGIMGIYG
ncbi:MAG: thiazole synthase [Rickettsiales bacterium]